MAILPSRTAGQTNCPSSRRLVNRHRPSASAQRILTVSPLRPRKINRWPENGLSSRTCWTSSPRPLKDLRISVTPATSQIRVPDGKGIIGSSRSARGSAFSEVQVINPRTDAGWHRRQSPRMSWPRGRLERRVHSAAQHGVTGPYQAGQRG